MKLDRLTLHRFDAALRVRFRHASASRARTENAVVAAATAAGAAGFGEGCPRAYVTGETFASVARFFARHRDSLMTQVSDVATLVRWRDGHDADIARNPAAYAAIELALLDAIGRDEGRSVEDLLGLPPLAGRFRYSAVLGDGPWPVYRMQLARYRRAGFDDFKIKLSGHPARDHAKLAPFRGAAAPVRVRADANNLWPDAEACIAALAPLDFPWFALEEPVTAHRLDDFRRVGAALGARIVLDESFLDCRALGRLADDPGRWILNLRVSKLGGLTRAVEAAERARRGGFGVIVGAHVGETSILTRAGLTLATAAGDALVAQEGAFGTRLLRADVAAPALMFGDGGVLEPCRWAALAGPGLGLHVVGERLTAPPDGARAPFRPSNGDLTPAFRSGGASDGPTQENRKMHNAIGNLKEISRRCLANQALDPELSRWLGVSLQGFLTQEFRSVDAAFGLRQPPGGVPWWREEAMWTRDTALRVLAAGRCDGWPITRKAREIRRISLRYAASAWRHDREREAMPESYAGTDKELLWRAFKSGAPMPLGERQLRSVLAG